MNRRDLLTGFVVGAAYGGGSALFWQKDRYIDVAADNSMGGTVVDAPPVVDALLDREAPSVNRVPPKALLSDTLLSNTPMPDEQQIAAASVDEKVRHFELDFADDIRLPETEHEVMQSVLLRLERVQKVVGHGNFNVLSFDDALKFAKRYSSAGAFTPQELNFLEKVYFTDAATYGFFGERVTEDLTARISRDDTVKVPYSGHFLFKGESLNYYEKLKADIGENIILTSGIRSNVKQMHLFLAKTAASGYNLSKASRSLAPPGHSFHGIGDFDVGRVGWGYDNFTDRFAKTDEFKRMQDLGYVQIRYTENNRLGVRFEPWHIKVA